MGKRKTKKTRAKARRTRRTPEEMIADLERELAELRKRTASANGFSPTAVKKERDRLELSAADYAQLVGVSGLTIYNWEKGRARPQAAQMKKWADVKGIGKRQAWRKLGLE